MPASSSLRCWPLFVCLAAALGNATPRAQTPKTNVLVLIADDLGVDYVRCYAEGARPANTPNVDALAARGVMFRNAWAYPLCSPTRAALMTGRFGFRTGKTGNGSGGRGAGGSRRGRGGQRGGRMRGGRDSGEAESDGGFDITKEFTLPKLLDHAESGYAHAKIGKWHLGGGDRGPNDAGWSHFAGVLRASVGRSYSSWQRTENGRTARTTVYATTQQADDALAFIRRQEAADTPWVCVVSFNAPHTPFHRPPAELHSVPDEDFRGRGQFANYRAMVEAVDTEIGRMLAELGEARDRTNILFMGDNGTPRRVVQERQRSAKGRIYEGGVNVPMIAAGPAVRGEPRETAALVHVVDVFATVAEFCGVVVRDHLADRPTVDSVSFAPVLRDPDMPSVRATVYTELASGDSGFAAIRDDRYKLVRVIGGDASPADQLFDLQEDPFEQDDLLSGEPLETIVARYESLRTELERLQASK